MADISERIEKQMEGTSLALAAVAEVLQKMDGRFQKEEQASAIHEQNNANALAKAGLVKSIAREVLAVLKNGQGLDVSGGERKAKSTGGTPQNADDSESTATIGSKTEDAQNTIQAMHKGEFGEDDEDEDEEEKGGMAYKQDDDEDDADDEPSDYPVEEKNTDEDEEEPDEMKAMRKQIASMKKQLEATEAGMQKAIQTESENRLRKMGFREEIGLQAPQLTHGLGVDGSTTLVKAASQGDTVEQLSTLSYSDLRKLQHNIEMGNTEGVPKELLS